MVDLYEEAIT